MSGTMCFYCGAVWTADNCRGRVRPRPKQNKPTRQLQKKYHHQPWLLKPWQRRLVKLLFARNNRLEILCLDCRKTRKSRMSIPIDEAKDAQEGFPIKKKKQKRKKKDPSAGLMIPLRKTESVDDKKLPAKTSKKRSRLPVVSPPVTSKIKLQSRTVRQLQEMLKNQNKKTGKSITASLKDFLDSV